MDYIIQKQAEGVADGKLGSRILLPTRLAKFLLKAAHDDQISSLKHWLP